MKLDFLPACRVLRLWEKNLSLWNADYLLRLHSNPVFSELSSLP